MMLFYKAWRETRARFLIGAALLAALCLGAVLFQERLRLAPGLPNFRSTTYSEHIYQFIYAGSAKGVYLVLILPFLGAGGLRRERARGVASFTLALPVSRSRIAAVQFAVGVLESAVLAVLPVCVIPAVSRLIQQSYPVSEALRFGVLWFGCGLIILAAAFFYSAALPGDYGAPIAAIVTLFAFDTVVSTSALLPYHLKIGWIAAGHGSRGPGAALRGAALDPIPWATLIAFCAVALAVFAAGIVVMRRQDY
jgi:ABC-2 type transport system permease protein